MKRPQAHDVWMPVRSRAVVPALVGRGAPIGCVLVIGDVRASAILLKEGET